MANRKYDQQLKKDVIDAVLIGNKTAAQVVREHSAPETAVYSWIRSYKDEHDIAKIKFNNETPEQEITRLKVELKKASQERDILKKATAYFASLET
jgi:transposase